MWKFAQAATRSRKEKKMVLFPAAVARAERRVRTHRTRKPMAARAPWIIRRRTGCAILSSQCSRGPRTSCRPPRADYLTK